MCRKLVFLAVSCLLLTSCVKDKTSDFRVVASSSDVESEISKNVENVFGVSFDKEQDWCTTTSHVVDVTDIPSETKVVQVLAFITEGDGETSLKVLNETSEVSGGSVKMVYDLPSNSNGVYVAFISDASLNLVKVTDDKASFVKRAVARRAISDYVIPSVTPVIDSEYDSYASIRGWIPVEKLYSLGDYSAQKMTSDDYDDAFKESFRKIIFSCFKNGKTYNNLPIVIESGIYDEKAYPFTTGQNPIIVTPVYKCDGAGKYGNEVHNSDLYYYYYKGENLSREELEALPKYRAIKLKDCFTSNEDDIIGKRGSYTLIYWGDGIPSVGTTGSYQFPEGYRIGFMIRANTTAENKKKQGELYGDGRLNTYINTTSLCNFKNAGLAADAPRLAWITVEDKMFMCFESGTDKDYNDVIFEVEGGVKPIVNIPEFENNSYVFCFEDTRLGDYDMNDVVIMAKRLSETKVEYTVMACGAFDEVFIHNINGEKINNGTEVHAMFNASLGFINTVPSDPKLDYVTEVITVPSKFSFLDEETQPFIFNKTKQITVKVSKKGEDPHGIMIPYDFKYPIEKVCIKEAYLKFNEWGQNRVTSTDWYKYPEEDKIYKK